MPTTAFAVTVTPPVSRGFFQATEVRIEDAANGAGLVQQNPGYLTLNGDTPFQERVRITDVTTLYFVSNTPVRIRAWIDGDDVSTTQVTPGSVASPAQLVLQPQASGPVAPAFATEMAASAAFSGRFVSLPVVPVVGVGIDPTGVTDSTAAINALIAANPGAVFNFEAAGSSPTFRVSGGPLIAGVPCTLRLGSALINQVTSARAGIRVTSSNVRLEGGTVQGPQFANNVVGERGIEILGASAVLPLSNVSIARTRVRRFGEYGIFAEHLRDFDFDRPDVADCHYGGITGISVINGDLWAPHVQNIPADGVNNAYGISFSRQEVNSLVTDPLSENVTVHSPTVIGVPTWTGLDTHGGKGIRFLDVDVRNCRIGVGIVGSDGAGQVPLYGPKDCVVTGTIDSGVTNGTADSAVWFAGVSAGNGTFPFSTLATGIIDVTIKGHGDASSALGGGVYMRSTYGVKVTVRAERCSRYALLLYYDNYAFTADVTAIDTWSNTGTAAAIGVDSAGFNQGTVLNQTDRTSGTFSPPILNAEGIRTGAVATNVVHVVSQRSTATTPIVEGAGSTCRTLISPRATINNGTVSQPSLAFSNSPSTGLYRRAADQLAVSVAGAEQMFWSAGGLTIAPGVNISTNATTGTMLGVGASQRLGFWGATPVPRPTATPAAATDLATALTLINDLRAKLITVGLIA